MKALNKSLLALLILGISSNASLFAQSDDIESFIKAGKECYKKGNFQEAALEFENVLIIDKNNFDARIWLTQIYLDKKDFTNARKLLTEASLQSPNHPRVKALQRLMGDVGKSVKPNLVDPVIAETIGGIASATKRRTFGLVIPEDKIVEEDLEKKLLTFDNDAFDERNEVIQTIKKSRERSNISLNDYLEDKSNPLAPVFALYHNEGLNAALDKYFELVMKTPSLASANDGGLIDEGNKVFAIRFSENPDDLEARYFYGALQYINGEYADAEKVLDPFVLKPGIYKERLKPFFLGLYKWREQEKQRIAHMKYEEELRLAKEAQEKAAAEADSKDVWAQVKNKGNSSNKNNDLVSAGKSEAVRIHNEAYSLYKKGKLDDAIAKFEEAIAKDPENPEFNYHIGLAWTDKGLAGDAVAFENAITSFQKVISMAPDSSLAKEATSMINDIQQARHAVGER